jgi:hypothetical protein
MLKLEKLFDILFVHIAILGTPSLDILIYVNELEYFVGVMKKLEFMWVACLVMVVV